jgi:MoxR-like ATPase
VAFLDEVWKSNSAILNSLLAIVNERVHHEAGHAVPVPLLSLFGASNETPEDDSLNALYDRFLLRVTVPYLASDDSLATLLDPPPRPRPRPSPSTISEKHSSRSPPSR